MGSIKKHFVAKYKDDVNRTLYMFLEKEKGAAAGSNSLIVLNKQFYVGGYKELSAAIHKASHHSVWGKTMSGCRLFFNQPVSAGFYGLQPQVRH